MYSLVSKTREYTYSLKFSGNTRIPWPLQGIRVFTEIFREYADSLITHIHCNMYTFVCCWLTCADLFSLAYSPVYTFLFCWPTPLHLLPLFTHMCTPCYNHHSQLCILQYYIFTCVYLGLLLIHLTMCILWSVINITCVYHDLLLISPVCTMVCC